MKSNLIKISLIFFLFLYSIPSFGQKHGTKRLEFHDLLIKNKTFHKAHKSKHRGLLGFYKNYISSQDYGYCPYSPTCSVYTFASIKKSGLLIGVIKGLDRLSRCNEYQTSHYEHTHNNKLIDLP